MTRLYIASKDVEWSPLGEHLYLVRDLNYDGDDDPSTGVGAFVIRGGPDSDLPPFGTIKCETDISLSVSRDRFSIDANEDGQPDTPSDRNFTRINLPAGMNEQSIWNSWVVLAGGVQSAQHDYNIVSDVMTNSNSVITTMLSSIGLDIQDFAPILGGDFSWDNDPNNNVTTGRMDVSTFPGGLSILDTALDNTFSVFKVDGIVYSSTVFFKIDGTDKLIMEKGAELEIRGIESSDSLTQIILKGINLTEVTASTFGFDFKITDDNNINPFSDDLVRITGYVSNQGYNNTEFVFEDHVVRFGTSLGDGFQINSQDTGVSRTLDGRGGTDTLTYADNIVSLYDEKRGVIYGAGRDTLKDIENIELGNGYYGIRPDETKGRVQKSNEGFDYSHSLQHGNFLLKSNDIILGRANDNFYQIKSKVA